MHNSRLMDPTATHKPWLQHCRRKPQARLRMFCLPYAGGGASIYRTWVNDLPAEVEVWPVQLPGREDRLLDAPFTRLHRLVEALAQVLTPCLEIPFVLFGHSMGSLIAFELAQALRCASKPSPLHLFVSGCRAPQIKADDPPIYNLPEREFVTELRRLNGTSPEILQQTELMQLLMPVLRADFELNATYAHTASNPLDCPISAFGGLKDPEVSFQQLDAWRVQTRNTFTLRMLPGDHFFLRSARGQLLQMLTGELDNLLRQGAQVARTPG